MVTKRSAFNIVMTGIAVLITLAMLMRVVFVLVAPRSIVTGTILAVHYQKNDINGGPPTWRVQFTFSRPDGGSRSEVQVPVSVTPVPIATGPIRLEVAQLGPFWTWGVADYGIKPDFKAAARPPLGFLALIWMPVLLQWFRRKPETVVAW